MRDVTIVGAGVSGLAAGIFTARAGLDTLVIDGGEPILARNASLENYPGFPDGVDARLFLRLAREQAENADCEFALGRVRSVEPIDETDLEAGFRVETEASRSIEEGASESIRVGEDEPVETRRLIAASWPDSSYLAPLDVGREQRGSKHFVRTEEGGRTAVDGIYAAGRIADEPHQTVVAAGHGAKVALAAIHDAEVPFYHDWVAPEGYFTGRDIEVPPACEEIDDDERRARDERARQTVLDRFAEPLDAEPTMHPSVERDR